MAGAQPLSSSGSVLKLRQNGLPWETPGPPFLKHTRGAGVRVS